MRVKDDLHPRHARRPLKPGDVPGWEEWGQLDSSTLFVNMKPIAKLAEEQGLVDEKSVRILSGGVTALRRAYIVSGLRRGEQSELLTERLSHLESRAMRRYVEALPKAEQIRPL